MYDQMTMTSTGGTGWRKPLWLALLVVASVAFTMGFACATPLAAFAAAAAATLGRRDALLLAGGVWLANQIVGYGVLAYPVNADSLAWGAIMGAATLIAVEAARPAVALVGTQLGTMVRFAAAFAIAFLVYEVLLYVPAVAGLSGIEEFEPSVVLLIFKINAAALAALWAVDRLGRAAGLAPAATAQARTA